MNFTSDISNLPLQPYMRPHKKPRAEEYQMKARQRLKYVMLITILLFVAMQRTKAASYQL